MAGVVFLAHPLASLGAGLGPLLGVGIIQHLQRCLAALIGNQIADQPGAGIEDVGIAGIGIAAKAVIKRIVLVVDDRSRLEVDRETTRGLREALAGETAKQRARPPSHEFRICGGQGVGCRGGGDAATHLVTQLIRAIDKADATGGLGTRHTRIEARQNGETGIVVPFLVDAILITEKKQIVDCERINHRIEIGIWHDLVVCNTFPTFIMAY